MAQIDPAKLKPAQLTRLLNSAGLGEVLNERTLRRHRNRAGYLVGDLKTINLFKYAAWLTGQYLKPEKEKRTYDQVKERARQRNAQLARSGQEIGPLPEVISRDRKEKAQQNFRFFCETYFPEVFYLSWSPDHLVVIETIEKSVLKGGLFALAMPRGSGKALALDTPLATPEGWTTMGQVQVGDRLFDEQGQICQVTYVTEVMYGHPCYRVRFSDGEEIVCDRDHLWTVQDRYSRKNPLTLTTGEMAPRVDSGIVKRYCVPPVQSISNSRRIVSIEPTDSVPVRCIQVDSPSHLYLAGRKMVPTHNTVLMQMACLWSALSGSTEFVCLIAASAERAKDLLENIKVWLETNHKLLEDFPEVVFPIRALERITNRQKGQKYQGEPTRIEWASDKIVLPTIEGSTSCGVVISCSGMKGSDIRGQNYARSDGRVVRPQLVMVDDPQTTESAWSPSQSQRREAILAGDVLGMAGPGKKISGLMACTVIRPGDMADNILDREKHPEWQGQRTRMVYSFPSNEKLWQEYAQIRADSLRNDGDGDQATEFYRSHRKEMDKGAVVAWPERHNDDELSAIQHAMNLKLRDEAAFFAEYQNEPIVEAQGDEMLTADEIAQKLNGYARGIVPVSCQALTMFIDVQQKALFWMLCSWEENFTGYIVDYGTWPDQKRAYFTLRDIRKTIAHQKPGSGLEGSLYHALEQFTQEKLTASYRREDGMQMKIDRCLIDANWGQSTDVVYQFCRQSRHLGIVLPSHGKYVGASSIPFAEYKRKRGDRVGLHWRIPNTIGKRAIRHVLIDTNYWKSFVHARLAVAMGDPGCLSLYGRQEKDHRLLSEHLTAEYRVRTEARERTVDEWKLKAARPDNHWLDCLVGCGVAASMQGMHLFGTENELPQRMTKLKLSALQRRKLQKS